MKKIITLLVLLLITISTFAQQGFNYKAVIKDDSGNLVTNQNIDIRFTLQYLDPVNGYLPFYQEVHNVTSDANGIVILNIGEGTVLLGSFPQSNWGTDTTMLTEIDIETDGSFITLPTSNFKKVPMAIRADYAAAAGNVNGLEAIDEGNGIGWRLIGSNTANYGNIGENAVNLSFSDLSSSDYGATGANSTAMGIVTTASGFSSTAMGNGTLATGSTSTAMGNGTSATGSVSTAMGSFTVASGSSSTAIGDNTAAVGNVSTAMGSLTSATGSVSTAMGRSTEASGDRATAMGTFTTAKSYAETAIGIFSTDYTPISPNFWYGNDRIFNIGNGFSNLNRSDALTVLKNGTITAPSVTNSLINTAGDKALITKEYADTNYLVTNGSVDISIEGELQQTSTGTANLIPLAYGIVESTGSVLSGTGNFTAFLSGNVFIIDVNGTESLSYSNTVAIITPISTTARTSSTIIADGNGDSDADLNVRIFTASGSQVTTTFQFVIYKL